MKRKFKKLLILVSGLLITLLVYDYWQTIYGNILHLDKKQSIAIHKGESFNDVLTRLNQRDVLNDISWLSAVRYIQIYSRLSGIERNIQVGEYHIHTDDTVSDVLHKFNTGNVIHQKFTIIGGTTFAKVIQEIKKHPDLTLADSNLLTLIQQLGLSHPEGWLFPDTYRFSKGTDAMDILRKSIEKMQSLLQEKWEQRKASIPLKSPYEALILASIIEKESGYEKEKRRISAVFINRLNKKMRLQADPTVIYGLGDAFKGNLTRKHLQTSTPYNTYTQKGLPPTPIALPTESSIDAAMNPSDDKALYFVSTGDGKHHFSYTYKEHSKAVRKYQLKRK